MIVFGHAVFVFYGLGCVGFYRPAQPTHQKRKRQAMRHHDPFEGIDVDKYQPGPRPYYNPLPAIIRHAERVLSVLVRFSANGVYLVKRPNDETMSKIKKA
jgi:hypothetical protein